MEHKCRNWLLAGVVLGVSGTLTTQYLLDRYTEAKAAGTLPQTPVSFGLAQPAEAGNSATWRPIQIVNNADGAATPAHSTVDSVRAVAGAAQAAAAETAAQAAQAVRTAVQDSPAAKPLAAAQEAVSAAAENATGAAGNAVQSAQSTANNLFGSAKEFFASAGQTAEKAAETARTNAAGLFVGASEAAKPQENVSAEEKGSILATAENSVSTAASHLFGGNAPAQESSKPQQDSFAASNAPAQENAEPNAPAQEKPVDVFTAVESAAPAQEPAQPVQADNAQADVEALKHVLSAIAQKYAKVYFERDINPADFEVTLVQKNESNTFEPVTDPSQSSGELYLFGNSSKDPTVVEFIMCYNTQLKTMTCFGLQTKADKDMVYASL